MKHVTTFVWCFFTPNLNSEVKDLIQFPACAPEFKQSHTKRGFCTDKKHHRIATSSTISEISSGNGLGGHSACSCKLEMSSHECNISSISSLTCTRCLK